MRLSKFAAAVQVELDKPRTLILDFNAFALFSDVTGQELPDVFAGLFERDAKGELVFADKKRTIPKVAKDFTAKQLRAAIWAGLHHEDHSLTLSVVGRYISHTNRTALSSAVFQSLLGMEAAEQKDPTPAVEAQSTNVGTGIVSGPSAASSSV